MRARERSGCQAAGVAGVAGRSYLRACRQSSFEGRRVKGLGYTQEAQGCCLLHELRQGGASC